MSENESITSSNTSQVMSLEWVQISESFKVEDDGVYHIIEKGDTVRKDLVMPKATFIAAFRKYIGGDL